jgi:hypothetical protein
MHDIRYLAFGLLIGIIVAALGAAMVFVALPAAKAYSNAPSATLPAPTPSLMPTRTLAPTATFTPTPTAIPPTATEMPVASPTATLEPVQALINSGGLRFTGPLSSYQQIALYKAAIYYARTTVPDSKRVGVEINGAGYGDPSNICGPLAIAILRDAGLLPPSTVPHDFWLLNPLAATDAARLTRTFPPAYYNYTRVITPINKIDWRASPLVPGDFLFLWHGSGGNFDHMLVVSRVDNLGRAYAVTNYGTPDGFIISEVMLYDPGDRTAGLFHQWTQEQDAILGSTGFGGFELWRRK